MKDVRSQKLVDLILASGKDETTDKIILELAQVCDDLGKLRMTGKGVTEVERAQICTRQVQALKTLKDLTEPKILDIESPLVKKVIEFFVEKVLLVVQTTLTPSDSEKVTQLLSAEFKNWETELASKI